MASKKEFTKGLLQLSMQALTGTPPAPAAAAVAESPAPLQRRRSRRRRSRSKRSRSKRSRSKRSRSKRSKRSRSRRSGHHRRSSSYSDSYSYDDEQEPSYSGHYWAGSELPRDCRKYSDMTEKMAMEVLHILAAKWYLSIIYVFPVGL